MQTDCLYHFSHLIQLLWTDVGTTRKAKVYQTPFAEQINFRKRLVFMRGKVEWTANLGSPHLRVRGLLAYSLYFSMRMGNSYTDPVHTDVYVPPVLPFR
jgi:hypothetical protein